MPPMMFKNLPRDTLVAQGKDGAEQRKTEQASCLIHIREEGGVEKIYGNTRIF
jgi:hypothetical protein